MKKHMYIVLELFPEPHVVTDGDGNVMWFDALCDASDEAKCCQRGIVVNTTLGCTC